MAIAAAAFTGGATLGLLGYGSIAAAGSAGAWGALMAAGAAGRFVAGGISTGTWKGAFRGAVFGGLSAGIAYGAYSEGKWAPIPTENGH